MLNDNQCTDFLLSHAQTSHYHRHNIIMFQYFFLRPVKETGQCTDMPVRTQSQQETAYLVLKQYDQRYHAHIHQSIEDGTQQLHLQNLSHHQPDQYKNQNTGEYLDRAGSLHQLVCIIQQESRQQNINKIFYAKFKKHRSLILIFQQCEPLPLLRVHHVPEGCERLSLTQRYPI